LITKAQAERRNYIVKRSTDMLLAKRRYADFWPLYERVFKMSADLKTGEDEWRATLPDTWTFATIKTAQSAFVDSKVIPTIIRHEDDPASKAEDLKNLYTDIAEKGNLDKELYYARLDAFKLGNGFIQTIYNKETRTVWDIKKFDPKTNTFIWKQKQINEFDDPKTFRVSPYLVLLDDLGRAGNFRDCIILEVMGRDEAENKYGHLVKKWDDIPKTTELLKMLIAQGGVQIAETDGTGLRGTEFESLTKYQFFAPGFDWSDDVVEIQHYWNKGIKTPSGASDSYEILINGYPAQVDTKGSQSPNPYIHKQIPLTHIPYSPYSGDELWAAGIIEIGMSETQAIKKHREMMSDRQKVSLFSPAFTDVNDEIDQKQLKLAPLSLIRTKGGIPHQFQIPGITNADIELRTDYESSFKRAVGIDERMLGIESSGPKLTATEVSFLRESAMKRLREFSFLYQNALLQGEIKLKLSLFKQYFSNPLVRENAKKKDAANRILKVTFKEFKVKTGSTYYQKEINPNFFEGEVDVDLDLALLLPMTQAQMVTMWSQILRDATPFVQAGVIDLSLKKVFEKYLEALGSNINDLREDKTALAIEMAEAEHNLYADPNTSAGMKQVLPNGTQSPYLSPDHILKHDELLRSDIHIEDREKARLLAHIKQDIDNLKQQMVEQQKTAPIPTGATAQVGGLPGAPQMNPASPVSSPTAPVAEPTVSNG
jgi:hypothetical protein